MRFRKAFVISLAMAAGIFLIFSDFINPDNIFVTGLAEYLRNYEHPGPVSHRSPERLLHTAGYLAGTAGSILLIYAFPGRVGLIARRFTYNRTILRYLGTGLAVSAGLAGLTILSIFTPFTLPLALLSGLILFFGVFVGIVSILLRLFRDFLGWAGWRYAPTVLVVGYGLLLVSALGALPYFGVIIWAFLWLVGLGIAFSSRFGTDTRWTLRPLYEELDQ
jgi:hypothetical protein